MRLRRMVFILTKGQIPWDYVWLFRYVGRKTTRLFLTLVSSVYVMHNRFVHLLTPN